MVEEQQQASASEKLSRRQTWFHTGPWQIGIYALLLLGITILLFLSSDRNVNGYDGGIALTGAMRVLAGQVIHRDFYYNYGPAALYMTAATFKMFGQYVVFAAIVGEMQAAVTALTIYLIIRRLANPVAAGVALLAAVLWSEALNLQTLLTFVSTWLLLPAFQSRLTKNRAFWAGFAVSVTALFRYDLGLGLMGAHVIVLIGSTALAQKASKSGVRALASRLGLYLLGCAILVAPLLLTYVVIGAFHDFAYDIFLYPSKYYYAARHLPFPVLHRWNFEDVVAYIFPLIIAAGFYAVVLWSVRASRGQEARAVPEWIGSSAAFSTVALVMYGKGFVRIGAGPLALCVGPCLAIAAILCVNWTNFHTAVRFMLVGLLGLFAIGGWSFTFHVLQLEHREGSLMLEWLLRPKIQAPHAPYRAWCQRQNPLSRGFCYFVDDNHIDAIEYLVNHTSSQDTLYVGLPHHDRILINDNITYFATQRLPATKWSHFDPFLENRDDIQTEMIIDLERNKPPYAALDSEFEDDSEPNGSAVNTGVHLLDDYIAAHYTPVQTFGEMTILKRR